MREKSLAIQRKIKDHHGRIVLYLRKLRTFSEKSGGALLQMKISLGPRKFRILRGSIVIIAVFMIAYVGYAALQLTVSNSATVTPTTTSPNLFLSTGQTSTTVCSALTTGYSESPSINWGSSVAQLSTQDQYACLENTGSTHALVISTTFSSTDGTLNIYSGGTGTTPLNGASIPSGGFILVHFQWVVSSTAPLGSTTFNIGIA